MNPEAISLRPPILGIAAARAFALALCLLFASSLAQTNLVPLQSQVNVYNGAGPSIYGISLRLLSDEGTIWLATWQEGSGSTYKLFFSTSEDGGRNWTTAARVNPAAMENENNPALVHTAGSFFLCWDNYEAVSDVKLGSWTPRGSWSAPFLVTSTPQKLESQCQLAGQGTFLVLAYRMDDSIVSNPWPNITFTQCDVSNGIVNGCTQLGAQLMTTVMNANLRDHTISLLPGAIDINRFIVGYTSNVRNFSVFEVYLAITNDKGSSFIVQQVLPQLNNEYAENLRVTHILRADLTVDYALTWVVKTGNFPTPTAYISGIVAPAGDFLDPSLIRSKKMTLSEVIDSVGNPEIARGPPGQGVVSWWRKSSTTALVTLDYVQCVNGSWSLPGATAFQWLTSSDPISNAISFNTQDMWMIGAESLISNQIYVTALGVSSCYPTRMSCENACGGRPCAATTSIPTPTPTPTPIPTPTPTPTPVPTPDLPPSPTPTPIPTPEALPTPFETPSQTLFPPSNPPLPLSPTSDLFPTPLAALPSPLFSFPSPNSSPSPSLVGCEGVQVGGVNATCTSGGVAVIPTSITLSSNETASVPLNISGSLSVAASVTFVILQPVSIGGSLNVAPGANLNASSTSGALVISVEGNMSLSQNSTVTISAGAQSPIKVNGCVDFSKGTFNVLVEQSGSYNLASYSCRVSNAPLSLKGVSTDTCKSVTLRDLSYGQTQLQATFATENTCAKEGLSSGAIAGISVAVIIVVAALVAVIVILTVPWIRKRVFPHRDRSTFNSKSKSKTELEVDYTKY